MIFILVHGSWHGAWCWEKLMPLLQAQGHTVVTPDLPGHGSNLESPSKLGDYVKTITDLLRQSAEPAMLVGHSMAGAVISQAADNLPDKIARLIYLAAYIPADGESLVHATGQAKYPGTLSASSAIAYNKTAHTFELSTDILREYFYYDCPPDTIEWALTHIRSEPVRPYFSKLNLSPVRFGRLPKTYIICQNDRVLIANAQKNFASRNGCKTHILASGHSPFLSQPEEILTGLIDF